MCYERTIKLHLPLNTIRLTKLGSLEQFGRDTQRKKIHKSASIVDYKLHYKNKCTRDLCIIIKT